MDGSSDLISEVSEYAAILAMLNELLSDARRRELGELRIDVETMGFLVDILDDERWLRESAVKTAEQYDSAKTTEEKRAVVQEIIRVLSGSRGSEFNAIRPAWKNVATTRPSREP